VREEIGTGDLRGPLPCALDDSDFAASGVALARTDRRSDDRLVHNAHCIEMRGDSMSKNRGSLLTCVSPAGYSGWLRSSSFEPSHGLGYRQGVIPSEPEAISKI
jgi:hypothetical protein